ncbi:carbohydrate ABC transporter permease [Propionibacteriaceae bacterium Y1700]|uniref:carbohydrate ABC transporter permease n=1 Tax=Microlunatus sp. Y1700 TaxID=3418487 RepID=UPI003DA79082
MSGAGVKGRASVAAPTRKRSAWWANVALVLVGLVFVVPMLWLLLASFDEHAGLVVRPPSQPGVGNFSAVMSYENVGLPLINSTVLSVGAALMTVIIAVLAAYPLSRYRLRFGRQFMYVVLFGTCLPITAMMVPVYALFVRLEMLDSMPAVIAFLAATSLPMAIFMMKNFMDGVPVSLEEAAWTDGASAMQTLRAIVVPLMRPGLAVVFIFVFVQCWGNFFVPFILLLSPDKLPAAVTIFSFFGNYGAVAYGQLAAFSLLYSLPVLFLYVLVQRVLGGSFAMAGAVKG